MQEKKTGNAKKVIAEILTHYKIRKKSELARLLEVSPNTISTWEARDSINAGVVCRVLTDLNYDWVRTGEGEMLRSFTPRNGLSEPAPPLSWIVEWLWQDFQHPDAGMLVYEQMKDCFPDFATFCKKKREGVSCEN